MLITIEKVLLLKQMPLFKNVSNMALSDLMSVSEEQTCKAGSILIQEKEPNKMVYFLLSGAVEILKESGKKEVQAKSILGLKSVFWIGSADEQVKTTQKSVVLMIEKDKLYRVMALHPSLAFAILNELSADAHQ